MGYIDRHIGARKRAAAELACRDKREMFDTSFHVKACDTALRRQTQLGQIGELLPLAIVPEGLKVVLRQWQVFLEQNPTASLSRDDGRSLQGKCYRYVTKGGASLPEGWKPRPKPPRKQKPVLADFLRDPSVLPKKPPGRR